MKDAQKSVLLSENVGLFDKKDGSISRVVGDAATNDTLHRVPDGMNKNTHNTISVTVDNDDGGKKTGFRTLTGLSAGKKCTLGLATSASLLAGVTFSLIGPIYPSEATRKEMGITLIGFVYGLFGVVIFCTAPFFGSTLTKLGPKFAFISGIFVGGCCNILFGTLHYCPGGTPFIVMSILIRGTEAIGFSAYLTSSFAIVSSEFKENIGFVFGILETGNGLGFMLGPTIGGALYELGGFGLPFYIAGALVLINGILAYYFLPTTESVPAKRKGSMLSLLCNPMVSISAICLVVCQIGNASFFSTFANDAENLGMSVGSIGFLFGFVSVLYPITSILYGYISDTLDYQAPLIIGGQLVFALGFLILGLVNPFTIATAYTSVSLIGASFGCIFIPTMTCMVKGAVELGFENNIDTFALVSGLFNAASTLGGFLGSVGIGAVIQEYGYHVSYIVVGVLPIVMACVCAVFFTFRYFRSRYSVI